MSGKLNIFLLLKIPHRLGVNLLNQRSIELSISLMVIPILFCLFQTCQTFSPDERRFLNIAHGKLG